MFTTDQILKSTKSILIHQTRTQFDGISVNAQQNLEGKIYFALKGGGRDTHELLPMAIANKAAGVVVEYGEAEILEKAPHLTVFKSPFALKCFQMLGHAHRKAVSAKIIGITGSNGKTTVKEFAQQLIADYKNTVATKGNFNNHWGVPLTLISMNASTEVGIVEMGMNFPKEIASFVEIAEPDVVVCTNAAPAHMEQLGSLENIAKAKEEIYQNIKATTVGIFNLDNPWTKQMMERFQKRSPQNPILTYSTIQSTADVHLRVSSSSISGLQIEGTIKNIAGHVFVPVFGQHNVTNLMAAASIGLSVGLTPDQVWTALPLCRTAWGRNHLVPLKSGGTILFDSYNANPESMTALIQNVNAIQFQGQKIGVFGDMKELGPETATLHYNLGMQVAHAGYDKVYYIGKNLSDFESGLKTLAPNQNIHVAEEFSEELAKDLGKSVTAHCLITIKSSRDLRLEKFIPYCDPVEFQFYNPHVL